MIKRNFPTFPALAAAGLALAWAASAPAEEVAPEWTGETYRAVAREALRILPPALALVVAPHHDAVMEGAAQSAEAHRKGRHVFDPETGNGDLSAEVDRAVADGLRLLEQQKPMRDLAYQLGVMSHLAADFADPVRAAHAHPVSRRIGADFAAYTERNLPRFRPAFTGYPDQFLAHGLAPFVSQVGASARARHPLLARAYFPKGEHEEPVPSSTFTVRSSAFGVASLSYSHAVSATALVWTHFWRQARGDMKGTPFLGPEHLPPAPERPKP